MTKNQKLLLKITRIALPSVLTLLWLAFIYGNSLQTGVESGEASGGVYRLVNALPRLLGLGSPISEYFIRKAAHFTEFAILGILICTDLWCFSAVSLSRPLYIGASLLSVSIPICAVFASLDEFLQSFVDGRGPSVKDVIIDTSGALSATVLFIAFFCLTRYITRKYAKSNLSTPISHS